MAKIIKTMDGNEAAAYASYAFTEMAAIYPITPSSPMAEHVDSWASQGKKNIFGQSVQLIEMQSEAGAISAVHGALDTGVLSTTYTASQGLMLMIPTMFRIAGQLKSGVVHVASRNVATSTISIFAEHSDVMACRSTGYALLSSGTVQETMDIGAIAHLASIKGHIPFLHFFDGFRTSHEIQKVECLDYDDLADIVDYEELEKFRDNALNPDAPILRTTGQNSDTYFQIREAVNKYYDKLPDVVESCMEDINKITGRNYHLFNYYGAEDAEYVICGMGSMAGTAQETIEYLNENGKKVGYLDVHLFRPFSSKHFFETLPKTVKTITVLDRTKEPGAIGEPLFEEISSVIKDSNAEIEVIACRYGLASKDTTPAQVARMYSNMEDLQPRSHYTIGIEDDVTNLSIDYDANLNLTPKSVYGCKFWGLGSDGTVGANKNTIKIIGDHTNKHVQAYFEYDGRKSGGVTRSHLRFSNEPIRSAYLVSQANFVACHNQAYINKYDLTKDLVEGGNLLLNCKWSVEELSKELPEKIKRDIYEKKINLYILDATKIAQDIGLGNRTNTLLQSAFFKITNIVPYEDAKKYMKDAIMKSYGHKGEKIINMNFASVDLGGDNLLKVQVPEEWGTVGVKVNTEANEHLPQFIRDILQPVNKMKGDDIPVSAFFENHADGRVPQGTSKYEKRGVAPNVPKWDSEKCIQCNQCSFVCPHSVIRPFLLTEEQIQNSPNEIAYINAKGKGLEDYQYRITVSVLDCSGCGSCANVCPAPEKALVMTPIEEELKEATNWEYISKLDEIENPLGTNTVKGSQFEKPLLEFSGACPGCGETPYAKLVTQLFGDRMYIATATGCSQVWSTSFPSFPYTTNSKGQGPAVAGSLFENNAEFGFGIYLAQYQQRESVKLAVERLISKSDDENLTLAANKWLETYEDKLRTREYSTLLKLAIEKYTGEAVKDEVKFLTRNQKHFAKKSVWMFGGDGWAYDIGYGGLDHVLASGADVNILVMDTEVYSNTGGQASKSTPKAAIAKFASAGKRTKKKDLGLMAMNYKDVYVAQIGMGANQNQTLKAIKEAESYNGPSLIIAYSPCIEHGLHKGMGQSQMEIKEAVEAGYWQLYRYDPRLIDEGKNPFQLDSKEPKGDYKEFLRREVRYSSLEKTMPEVAEKLYEESEKNARDRYETYKNLASK